MSSFTAPVPLTTPVLFIAFNREKPARMVMEAIRQALSAAGSLRL